MRELLVVLALLASGSAQAESVQLAQVSKLTGLVRVARAGSDVQAQASAGLPLFAGDTVNTLSGRAEIAFPDGHILRMVQNTKLEVSEPPDKGRKGVFSRLLAGSVRAIVKKMAPGTSFEIQSSYAIASVKGTDVFFDGRTGSVRNEGDGVPHLLELLSLDGKTRLEIRDGMTGGFNADGSVNEPRTVGQEFFDALEKAFDVSAAPATGGGEAPAGGGEPAPGTAIDPATLRADLADFAESSGLSDYADNLEHASDVALGRILVDMHGYRVRVEEYITRPKLDTIQLLVLNSREGGPNAGRSTYQDDLRFNRDLPDNYEDVRRGLGAAFADPAQPPEYYLVSETSKVSNPRGDFIRSEALFGDPQPVFASYIANYGGAFTWNYMNEAFQTGWGQRTDLKFFVGNATGETLKEHFLYDHYGFLLGGWYAGAQPVAVYPAYSPNSGMATYVWSAGADPATGLYPVEDQMYMDDPATPDFNESLPVFNNPQFGTGTQAFFLNARGGFTAETLYGDGTFLRENFFFVADDGRVLDPQALFAGAENPDSFAGGLAGGLNFELEWEATEFADTAGGAPRTLDILIAPEIYEDAAGGSPTLTIDDAPNLQPM